MYAKESVGVASVMDKMIENRLRWYHVTRREDSEAVRTVMELNVE